jgi:hypothetical protein
MTTQDDHDRHDRFLIAALAAGDLDARALTDAHELVAACADCAELLADLRSIAAATAALPPLPRSTDFRLSPDTAARLGARGWRGFLVRLADSRFGFSRPLAVGLTTLGLVGAIAGSIPGAMGGFGAGPAPAGQVSGNALNATQDQGESRSSAGAAGASVAPAAGAPVPPTAAPVAAGSPAPTALYPVAVAPSPAARDAASSAPSPPPYGAFAEAPSPQATKGTSQESSRGAQSFSSGSTGSPGPPLLLVGSIALLLVGLGILGAQWVATKLTNRRIE